MTVSYFGKYREVTIYQVFLHPVHHINGQYKIEWVEGLFPQVGLTRDYIDQIFKIT